MARTKNKGRGTMRIIFIAIILLLLVTVYKVFGPNTGTFTEGEYLYVHTGSGYTELKEELETGGFVADMFSFNLLARQADLPKRIHPGKYKINRGMSNYNMIRMLRSGRQVQVNLVLRKIRTKTDLIKLLSANLEADSLALAQLLQNNTYLDSFGLDTNTAMCAIIPDTYFFKWNTNADKAFRKLLENYKKFWNETRIQQARDHGLTQTTAIILASIVDEETNMQDDKPKIASVYLNRIRIGMPLQADPTVKFAIGDFTIRRITGKMLHVSSPYNTYMNKGLPPGPICTPSIKSIDAVLQAPQTRFLYFCAREDFSGYSNFAATFAEQIRNARAYQKALNERGIH